MFKDIRVLPSSRENLFYMREASFELLSTATACRISGRAFALHNFNPRPLLHAKHRSWAARRRSGSWRFSTFDQQGQHTRASKSPDGVQLAAEKASLNVPHVNANSHLDPSPEAFSSNPFTDRCSITVHAGAGGNGCISFLREKYIAEGPPNGGDGGDGGSVYIQAIRGETSLHKIARRAQFRAGRGGHGRGKSRGGERGADVLITVPVGTIVRETDRLDPRAEDAMKKRRARADEAFAEAYAREKWLAYPGMSPAESRGLATPKIPATRFSPALAAQPKAPIHLDLDAAMERPMLLAAGAVGGLGNPHFIAENASRPLLATKGEPGTSMSLQLELKMLADVGLVGLPNAGKSTLLRALTNSRTRIGSWAFTTLQPNVGTIVLDDHKGRPALQSFEASGEPRTSVTIADIPGLVEGAHLDRGLGLDFLRHVERAKILVFVVDLDAGDAVRALRALWEEVGEYESLREREISAESELRLGEEQLELTSQRRALPALGPPISSKPWFVVANKADIDGTQANFANLQTFINQVRSGELPHPSGRLNAWRQSPTAAPVSAIRGEGVDVISRIIVDLL
ncbi:MAG: hypothetical protein Q9159_000638 [Coniocarpon cinnabarinum]